MKHKLRRLRTDKGISQKQIASIFPTDVSNYNRKELGEFKITKQEWEKISNFLNVPVEEIYEEDTEGKLFLKKRSSIKSDIINMQYNEMMPSVIENLQDFISTLKILNEELKKENQILKEENVILKSRNK